jgi:hypothetical protein
LEQAASDATLTTAGESREVCMKKSYEKPELVRRERLTAASSAQLASPSEQNGA